MTTIRQTRTQTDGQVIPIRPPVPVASVQGALALDLTPRLDPPEPDSTLDLPHFDLVALDGWKVDGAGLLSRCEDRRPGETVRVTVFRRDKLLEVPVVLGQKPAEAVWLARV